jgi:hypothetical protein
VTSAEPRGSWHTENVETRAGDDDQLIALCTMAVKGRGSEVELRRTDALVASFRSGEAVKMGCYNDQAQALNATGLVQ